MPVKQAHILSIVFHELATKAVKHGALSVEGGASTLCGMPNKLNRQSTFAFVGESRPQIFRMLACTRANVAAISESLTPTKPPYPLFDENRGHGREASERVVPQTVRQLIVRSKAYSGSNLFIE